MIIKLLDKTELVIPDVEEEYVKLVDLHDMLSIHESMTGDGWSSQCKTCGCQLVRHDDGRYVSLIAPQTGYVPRKLGVVDTLLAKEAVSRNQKLLDPLATHYGPSNWMWNYIDGLPDSDHCKQSFLGKWLKIGDETEDRIKDMSIAKSCYGGRLYSWAETIKKNAKSARKVILARNKEIWQTLKGHYGAERQRMIDELELGIKRRKALKAKENAAIAKLKAKRYGW